MIVKYLRLLVKRFEIELFKVGVHIFGCAPFVSASVIELTTLSLFTTFDGEFFAAIWSITARIN
jgi:hypothetical protein